MKLIQNGKEIEFYSCVNDDDHGDFFLFIKNGKEVALRAGNLFGAWFLAKKYCGVETMNDAEQRMGSLFKAIKDKDEKGEEMISLNLLEAKKRGIELILD